MNKSAAKVQQVLFYGLVFLLPWQTRWIFYDPTLFGETWEYGRLSVYSWDILLLVLVIWLWPKLRSEFTAAFRASRAFYFYLLLMSLAFLTGAWATEPMFVTYWGLRLVEGGALWLTVRAVRPNLKTIFWLLAAAGVLQALWGLAQFIVQDIAASKWLGMAAHPVAQGGTSVLLNEGGRWLRAYGGQVHPNVLGGLLVITSLATVWLYTRQKSQIQNPNIKTNPKSKIQISARLNSYALLLLPLFIIQLMGLFVAFSRAAWLALFVALLMNWWLVRGNRASGRLVIGITVMVFIIMGAILWQPTKARLMGASSSRLEQQAIEERMAGIGESQSLLAGAWWRGVGLGNYTAALADYMPGLRAYRYQPVHNLFLLILTELGMVGLGLALLFAWHRLKAYPRHLLMFLVPLAVTVWFDHYWWTSASMLLLFWLLVALPEAREDSS